MKAKLLKRKLKKAEILYGFKYYRNVNRGYRMRGMDMNLVREAAVKYGVTASQVKAYLQTGEVK